MSRVSILVASSFALLFVSLASCSAPSNARGAEVEVRALIDRQQAAWNSGDVEEALRLAYWDSPDLVFFSGGDVVRGFEPMLQRFLTRYKSGKAETGQLTFADVQIVPLGNEHALARGHWFVDFAKQEDQGGLFSLVLEKRREGWRIIHDHTSVEPPGPREVD